MSCPHCAEDHRLFNCKKFCKEEVEQRRNIAQSLGLCFNCLGKNHTTLFCKSLTKCRFCQRKHHTLLHLRNYGITSTDAGSNEPTPQQTTNIATHLLKGIAPGQVLLATALIRAESKDGSSQVLRALLDQGSQASFITEAAAQLLRLKKIACKTKIAGIGGNQSGVSVVSNYVVSIDVQSLYEPSYATKVSAHVLSSLTSVTPDSSFEMQDWPEIHNIQLADPHFNSPNKIDVLLGADVYCQILKKGLIRSPRGSPVAQDTRLGWIVSGLVGGCDISHTQHNLIITMHVQIEENDMLKRLWELDSEPSLGKKLLTSEEQACEEYFNATTKRDETGRYIVKLPFRCDDPPCKYGDSKSIAIKRLFSLERKLARDAKLKSQYSDVIKEYLFLGHLEKITDESARNRKDAVYLPHHAVVREDKLTTKVRVVYDASCKGTNGVSLNDTLMVGPTLQADLRHIVLRWRQHPICLTADIVKMYRQVKLSEEHVDFQCIELYGERVLQMKLKIIDICELRLERLAHLTLQ